MGVSAWVGALVLDLKLQLLGETPHNPITLERLEEWSVISHELDRCGGKLVVR